MKMIEENPKLFSHILGRIGTICKFFFKDGTILEGILKEIDYPRMWVEAEGTKKTFFINLHKLDYFEGCTSEEAINNVKKKKGIA